MKKNRATVTAKKVVEVFEKDPKKQIKELNRLIKEGQQSGDFLLVGTAYCHLAETYSIVGNPGKILSCALKAVALLKDSNEYELLAKSYNSLGYAYSYQENNQSALVVDEIAYRIVKKHRIKGIVRIRILNNFSVAYHMLGDIKKSIRVLDECLELLRKNYGDNYTELAMYSLNLAECYQDDRKPGSALEVLKSMSGWIDNVSFLPVLCDYYLRYALLSYWLEDLPTGNKYIDTAFTLIPENVYPHPIYDDLRQASHFLSKNGDRERAEKILDLMTVYAGKNKGTMEQLYATRTMADFYRNFGEYDRAAAYYAKYEELNDKRMRELKGMQLNLHKATKNAEMEIRRLKQRMRKNEELISIEPMTGLLNRSALLRISSEFIGSAAKEKQKVGAIFLDIDYFKECNDTYGHTKGDEIIREIARICRKQETANIRFARYGGDEFFGITRGMTDEGVTEIGRRIARAVRSADIPHLKNPNGGRITLSIGIVNVAITDKTDTILEIANYADKALYYAKNAGRNAIYKLVHNHTDAPENSAAFIKIDF